MPIQFGGPIGPFPDRVQQRNVPVDVFGTCEYTSSNPPGPQLDHHVQMQLLNAIRNVIGQKMASGQLTFRHLGTGDYASVIPEIVYASGLQQQGIQVGNLAMQFGIDGHRPQRPQNQVEVEAHIHVGGLKINASSDKGLDTQGLQNQLKDKAKSQILWWGIGCGVLLLVALFIGGLGLYIWRSAATSMSSSPATASRTSTAAKWDGKSPFSCGGTDSVTISGVKANLTDTAITAGGNCNLTLVGCDITAPTAIEANGNANVTITGGSLNGSTYAVEAGGLAKVKLTGTKVTGKTQSGGGAKITGP
jgi:hypothetical protein